MYHDNGRFVPVRQIFSSIVTTQARVDVQASKDGVCREETLQKKIMTTLVPYSTLRLDPLRHPDLPSQ